MIGFFQHQPSGCYYYRILQKMEALNRAGIQTQMIEIEKDINNFDDFSVLQFYGVYPFSVEKVLQYLKEEKKKIVLDMDDALELIDETNPFYYSVKRDSGSFHEILPFVNQITVSTTKMVEYVKKYRSDVPVTILPNCYNEADWKFERPKRDGIRIGYAASPTHLKDLLMILSAIKNLQKKYDIKFLLMGFGPYDYVTSFKQIRYASSPQVKEIVKEVQARLEEIKWEWIPFVPYDQFFSTLTNLSLDFGLCPLENTPFNQHRSAIKALEYLKSGALALASNMTGYNEDFTSVLVNDNQWEDKIEYCITHPAEVEATKKLHLEWAKENRNIDSQVELLKSVYVG